MQELKDSSFILHMRASLSRRSCNTTCTMLLMMFLWSPSGEDV